MASSPVISSNPYDFINPIKDPDLFAGRHDELKEIEYYLELSKDQKPKYFHLALIGSRSAGKTSILNIIEHKARVLGLFPVKISLNKETVKDDVLFFKEVFDGIITKGAESGFYGGIEGDIYKKFRKIIDTLDVSIEIPFLFGTAYIGKKKDRENDGIPQHVLLHDLKEIRNEAKQRNIPSIVLIFDECDLLSENEVLLQKIRNAFQEIEGYLLVLSGTEKMFPKINDVFSPIPRFFKRINIENFKKIGDVEECLLKPLKEEEQNKFDKSCIPEILRLTNGSPYEINLIAHHMYRRWKDGKNEKIGLSPLVLDDVLNEIERLRVEGHHNIATKIQRSRIDHLKILLSLLEFPNVPKKWLIEYILLNQFDTLSLKEVHFKRFSISESINFLINDGLLEETDWKINFKGDNFDILYLKYFSVSKEVKNIRSFYFGNKEDPLSNLHYVLIEKVICKDIDQWEHETKFDKRIKIGNRFGQLFAKKVIIPAGKSVLISPADHQDFYLDSPYALRFRINIKWMSEGFIIKIKTKSEDDARKISFRLNDLKEKFEFLGYEIILKDEISWMNEGLDYLNHKEYENAIDCFDTAIKINPYLELAWANRAFAFFSLQKYTEALESIDKAIELKQDWIEVLNLKGAILINLKKNSEALEIFESAFNIDPQNWVTWDGMSRSFFNQGNYERAIDACNHSLKFNPDNLETVKLKIACFVNLGKFKDALEYFEKSLSTELDSIDNLFLKGEIFCKLENFPSAIECFEKILIIDKDHFPARFNRDSAIIELKRVQERSLASEETTDKKFKRGEESENT